MDAKFLSEVSLFKGLEKDDLKHLVPHFKKVEVDAGTEIIKEGDTGVEMYILYQGKVQISKTLVIKSSKTEFSNEDKTFITLDSSVRPFFGELGLLMADTRSATVKALTPCVLYAIDRTGFLNLCEDDYRIGFIIVKNISLVIAQRLKRNNEDLLKLTTALSIALRK